MSIELREYQRRAVEDMVDKCVRYLRSNQPRVRTYGLLAPTGSGKGVMMAFAMKGIFSEFKGQVAVVCLTPSIGGLDYQLIDSFRIYTNRSGVKVYSVEEALNSCPNNMAGSIVPVGWDTINDEKDGQPTNIFMRPGDRTNFPEMLANTRAMSIPIVLFIDEEDLGADTKRSQYIIDTYIKPSYIFRATATPKNTKNWDDSYKSINNFTTNPGITYREVAKSGMVKNLIWKQTFGNYKDGVRGSVYNLVDLIELAKECGANYNPKMLIYIANGELGKEQLAGILEVLLEFSWSENSGDVVLSFSDNKTDKTKQYRSTESTVKVIITKEAEGRGVDNTSINIIVQLRTGNNTRVKAQHIGRGVRMPEQKHYGNDLDTLLYRVFAEGKLDWEGAELMNDEVQEQVIELKKEARDIIGTLPHINSMYYERIPAFADVGKDIFEESFVPLFSKALTDKGLSSFIINDKYEIMTSEGEVDPTDQKDNSKENGTAVDNVDSYKTKMRETLRHLNKFISVIEACISRFLDLENTVDPQLHVDRLRIFILNNLSEIKALIGESINVASSKRTRNKVLYTYKVPNNYDFAGEKEERFYKNFAYNRYFVEGGDRKQGDEKEFEKYLDTLDGGVWGKNYASKKGISFSVPYFYDGKYSNFYPDYWLWFAGKLFWFDTKKGKGFGDEPVKMKELVSVLSKVDNCIGGLVWLENDRFYLDRGNGKERLDNLLT
jgi:type III restriction enzyme